MDPARMCCNGRMRNGPSIRPLRGLVRTGPSIRPLRGLLGTGFTLIELMIVVTVLGIIATIAIPAYGNYVVRANRAAAKAALLRIAGQQESFYSDRKQYATALNNLSTEYAGATVFLRRDGNFQAGNTAEAIYSVTLGAYTAASVANCSVAGAATTAQYAIRMTPVNSQARDTACGRLCYGSPGDKGRSGTSPDCWSR
jgi:type IV pilus assembly protein PilE